MNTHPLVAGIVKNRYLAYIYGPPGSGKTRLGVHFFKVASSLDMKPMFIASEAGSIIVAESLGGEVRIAKAMDELPKYACEALVKGMYVVVDTVNSFYRGDPDLYSRSFLASTLALIRLTGGLALGQASELSGQITSPGLKLIKRYAKVVGYTTKIGEGKFKLVITKPKERIVLFKVEGDNIRWL